MLTVLVSQGRACSKQIPLGTHPQRDAGKLVALSRQENQHPVLNFATQ